MKTRHPIIIFLTTLLILPSLSSAYTVTLEDGRELINQFPKVEKSTAQLQYALFSVQYSKTQVKHVALNKSSKESMGSKLSLVSVAQAATQKPDAIINDYIEARKTIQESTRLEELKDVIMKSQYEALSQRILAGVHESVLLEMMKGLIPHNVDVYDSEISEAHATLIAMAEDRTGTLHGVITMEKENGLWKISHEKWVGDQEFDPDEVSPTLWVNSEVRKDNRKRNSLVSKFNKEYHLNQNMLDLDKFRLNKHKESFMFMFYVQKEQGLKGKVKRGLEEKDETKTSHLHILFTGPRLLVPKQKVYKEGLPLDVSMAHYKQGYRPGNLNLRLPRKKPKAVKVGLLYRF